MTALHHPPINDLLETVGIRLGETLEAFAAIKTISVYCRDKPALIDYFNENMFWRNVYAAFQIAVFTGIYSLVDKRKDCATLCLVGEEFNKATPGRIPDQFLIDLIDVRDRYGKYRHKVFAHTDVGRANLADAFDAEGFTWESISADLAKLEYAFKVLGQVMEGKPITTPEETSRMLNIYTLAAGKVADDTQKLLKALEVVI